MSSVSTSTSNTRKQVTESDKAKLAQIRAAHSPFWALSRHLQLRLQYARLKVDHGWQKQSLNEVENLYFHHHHQFHESSESAEQQAAPTLKPLDKPLLERIEANLNNSASVVDHPSSASLTRHQPDEALDFDSIQTQQHKQSSVDSYVESSDSVVMENTIAFTVHSNPGSSLTTSVGEVLAPDLRPALSGVQSRVSANIASHSDDGNSVIRGAEDTSYCAPSYSSTELASAMSYEHFSSEAVLSVGGTGTEPNASGKVPRSPVVIATAAMGPVENHRVPNLGQNESLAIRPRSGVTSAGTQATSHSGRTSSATLTYDSFWSTHATNAPTHAFSPYANSARSTQEPISSTSPNIAAQISLGYSPANLPGVQIADSVMNASPKTSGL